MKEIRFNFPDLSACQSTHMRSNKKKIKKYEKVFDIPPDGRYMVKTNLVRKGGVLR